MGELINFPVNEKYFYMQDGDKVIGCCTDDLCFSSNEGSKVNIIVDQPIEKSEVKELMILWLALNYQDVLKYDEESKN